MNINTIALKSNVGDFMLASACGDDEFIYYTQVQSG
jgi:hypothetical protein